MAIRVTDKKYFLTAALELIQESIDAESPDDVRARVGQIIRTAGRSRHGNGLPSWSCRPSAAFFLNFAKTALFALPLAGLWYLVPSQAWLGALLFCAAVLGLGAGITAAVAETRTRKAWRFVELWYREQTDGDFAFYLASV